MITIRDVARQAGVSVATVSRVLNNSALVSPDTRDAVMQAVTLLGYRPNANAQALATQVSDTIGVVVMDVSDAFFGALVKAVDLVAQHNIIDTHNYQTDDPAIFAAGDIVKGDKTVVYAVKTGKEAAQAIHHYLEEACSC